MPGTYISPAETGFYYLQTRYYDPIIGRFINADGQLNDDILGNNQFSYCSNNPINRVDPNGQFWQEIADFFREIYYGAKQVAESSPSVYAVGGVAGVIDGPSPIADAIVVVGLVAIVAGVDAIFQNKKSDTKEKEKEKEIVLTLPQETLIYRYYATKESNLAPRKGIDYDGLSFSTNPPKSGIPAVVTTIGAVNSTGAFVAIYTGGTHVVVVPTTCTVGFWMQQGQNSLLTRILASVVVEI